MDAQLSDFSIIGNFTEGQHPITDSQRITIYLSFVLWILGYLGIFATLGAVIYMCITGLRLPPRDNRSTYIYINPENSHPSNKDLESESETDEEETPLLPRHNKDSLLPRYNKDSRPNACALQGVCVERDGNGEGLNGKGGNEGYGSFYNGVRSRGDKRDGYEADSDEEVAKT